MPRRAFRIGGWAALVVGALVALAAASVLVVGALALSGRVTYPVHRDLGPFSFQDTVSMPVSFADEVCQRASVREQAAPSDCIRFFVHGEDWTGGEEVRVQDANIKPSSAFLTGTVDLATTGGWSPVVAASVARKAVGLMVISGVLLLLWRVLANSAAGDVFTVRTARYVRGIGWLLIVGGVLNTVLDQLVTESTKGYGIEMFGYGTFLEPGRQAGIEAAQLAVGALMLLLATAFRHGAAVEAEQRLTV